ncbi:MAG: hypothetical protein JO184_08450, partial [Gammaproteobacteria bacterium]|nr:hypothetical protein [Gammaproteobacteria bacterium]
MPADKCRTVARHSGEAPAPPAICIASQGFTANNRSFILTVSAVRIAVPTTYQQSAIGGLVSKRVTRFCLAALLALQPLLAVALPLSEYAARKDDTLELFIAGSSAQDSGLQNMFRLICEANTLDVYRASGVRLLFCRTKRGAAALRGFPQGEKVAFHKSSAGGSGSGVGPLIQRTAVDFLNIRDLKTHFDQRCPSAKRTQYSADGALIAYTEHECANPTPDHQVPDAGVSDVDPQFLLGTYNLAPEAIDGLSVHHANAFIFGVPVSLALRNALQSARFPQDDACNPANPQYFDVVSGAHGTNVPRGESEQCMPSLSQPQLAGMFSGRLFRWNQLMTPNGSPLTARDPQSGQVRAAPGIHAPNDDRVYICRRVDTSGTQAAYEMFFLHQRCTSGVSPFVKTGDNVFLGSVSNDVPSCLAALDEKNLCGVDILSTETVE